MKIDSLIVNCGAEKAVADSIRTERRAASCLRFLIDFPLLFNGAVAIFNVLVSIIIYTLKLADFLLHSIPPIAGIDISI